MSNSSLYIGLSGIIAQSQGLDTVSQNIANSNTPGYTRETVNLSDVVTPGSTTGSGVTVNSISQISSQFLQTTARVSSASQQAAQSYYSAVSTAQNYFQEPSPVGINEQLSNLWSAFDTLSNQPNLTTARNSLLTTAGQLTTTLNSNSQGLVNLYNTTVAQVGSQVATINKQLAQVESLNKQIVQYQGGSGGNTLIDQRNQLINSITDAIGATVQTNADGSVTLLSGGITLANTNMSDSLSVSAATAPPMPAVGSSPVSIVSGLSGATLPITSGSVGGSLSALNVSLPKYSSQLDSFTANLANSINSILTTGFGYSASGPAPAGVALFAPASGSTINAGNITVNPAVTANPNLISTAATSTAPMDGSIASQVGALGSSLNPPDAQYTLAVAGVGLDVSTAKSTLGTATSQSQSATTALSSVAGVNTNEELVKMINYQNAYQASAKVISTVASIIQSMIATV
ncbi:MAG: flagellar hook-associated protein FlgK [Actinomycetota bacterium]|nr:flagellar hook-associated protein FlgK [Actinomycetota bacterium]